VRDNPLLKRLREGGASVASFITIPDPFTAEVMGAAGVDVLVVDTETLRDERGPAADHLDGAAPTEAAVIVRVADNDPALIGQALDLGAEGVLVPGVRSRADCELAVRSCFYAPKGIRGFGPRRASRLYGARADYLARANEEIAVIAMIEHADALDDLDGIITTDNLSAVFVGTADLAVVDGIFARFGQLGCRASRHAHRAGVRRASGSVRSVHRKRGGRRHMGLSRRPDRHHGFGPAVPRRRYSPYPSGASGAVEPIRRCGTRVSHQSPRT